MQNEIPNRAPPLPKEVLHAMIGYALFKKWNHMALTLLLAYHGLLRSGELLSLQVKHVSIHQPKGPAVISLGLTKSGKRQGAAESVTVYSEDLCRRLHQWVNCFPPSASLAGPAHKWRKTFSDILKSLGFEQWDFRPYSLRRGGATDMFKHEGKFDRLLVVGRWQSSRTARVYLNEGLSVLAELKLPWSRFATTLKSQYLTSLRQPLPNLEPGISKKRQARGTWKKSRAQKRERGGLEYLFCFLMATSSHRAIH